LPWECRFSIKVGAPIEEIEEKARPMIPSLGSEEKEEDSEVTGEKYCLGTDVRVSLLDSAELGLPGGTKPGDGDSVAVDGTRGGGTIAVRDAESAALLGGGGRLGRGILGMGGASRARARRGWDPEVG
jgi:hypothetical protein